MNVFGRRNPPAVVLPEVHIPAHLVRRPDTAQTPSPDAPAPAAPQALDPRVQQLLAQSILTAARDYLSELDADIRRAEQALEGEYLAARTELVALRANFEAWKESQLASAQARAEDVAGFHADILRQRDMWRDRLARRREALEAIVAPDSSAEEPVPLASDAAQRLEDLARRLESVRPQGTGEAAE